MLSEMDMSCNNDIAKGKRTKRRLRPLSPCAVAAMTSSCSSASGGGGGGDYGSFSSNTFEEEEDMANCLILLAQGRGRERERENLHHHKHQTEEDKTTEIGTKIGFYIYECKTCNRTFPSFQALGGHRASHKKPKLTPPPEEKKPPQPPPLVVQPITSCEFEEAKPTHVKISPLVSLQLGCGNSNNNNNNNNRGNFHGNHKPKIHECSICGSEFTSGQALGGHMRRHRASAQTTCVEIKPRNVLDLDLNLPAPEDDLRDSKFQFPATQKSLALSAAPALVGCHY
ncbi:zinc finger protein ZAT5-like [Gastrolobium bilobum]|uniref:zinc finger protein ZAT5-like n=1 Tax=Gastrolobium bilobum TaxID=150636 RepID=UPI002AB0C13E|nr:zinc finger protein ZAT5-like [Gastrolobium bilobum]